MQGKSDINVTKIAFKFYNESCYEDITRDIKLYLQAIDETQFAVNDKNKKMFFDITTPVIETEETYEMLNIIYENNEIVFDLANTPFELADGKTLLVTAVFDAQDDSNCSGGTDEAPFYTSGIRGKAMVYTHNTVGFEEFAQTEEFPVVTSGTGTNVELPVTLIEYTYTEKATGIDEVEAATATNGPCYNLMGQKVQGDLPAGIYIQNGRKFIVR